MGVCRFKDGPAVVNVLMACGHLSPLCSHDFFEFRDYGGPFVWKCLHCKEITRTDALHFQ